MREADIFSGADRDYKIATRIRIWIRNSTLKYHKSDIKCLSIYQNFFILFSFPLSVFLPEQQREYIPLARLEDVVQPAPGSPHLGLCWPRGPVFRYTGLRIRVQIDRTHPENSPQFVSPNNFGLYTVCPRSLVHFYALMIM